MKKLNKWLVGTVLLVMSLTAQAISPAVQENELFWKIDKKGQPTSYIYTYYDYAKQDEVLPTEVLQAYQNTEQLVLPLRYSDESDEKFQDEMYEMMRLISNGDLEKILGKKRLNKARRSIKQYGDPNWVKDYDNRVESFGNETQTVMFTSGLFNTLKPAEFDVWDKKLPSQLEKIAKEDRKTVFYLSTLNGTLREFLKFDDRFWQLQVDNVLTLVPNGFSQYFHDSYDAYHSNNLQGLMDLERNFETGRLNQSDKAVIDNNNAQYLKTINQRYVNRLNLIFSQNSTLVLVPVENMIRDDNLLERLEDEGYQVTPMHQKQ